jgi:hypothetical protein
LLSTLGTAELKAPSDALICLQIFVKNQKWVCPRDKELKEEVPDQF